MRPMQMYFIFNMYGWKKPQWTAAGILQSRPLRWELRRLRLRSDLQCAFLPGFGIKDDLTSRFPQKLEVLGQGEKKKKGRT